LGVVATLILKKLEVNTSVISKGRITKSKEKITNDNVDSA